MAPLKQGTRRLARFRPETRLRTVVVFLTAGGLVLASALAARASCPLPPPSMARLTLVSVQVNGAPSSDRSGYTPYTWYLSDAVNTAESHRIVMHAVDARSVVFEEEYVDAFGARDH